MIEALIFPCSSLFRSRLIEGEMEYVLFASMLTYFKQRGLGHSQVADNGPMPPMYWRQSVPRVVSFV